MTGNAMLRVAQQQLPVDDYGKFFDGPEAWPSSVPTNGLRWRRQFELRPTFEESFQGAFAFYTCELVAQAEMDARAE